MRRLILPGLQLAAGLRRLVQVFHQPALFIVLRHWLHITQTRDWQAGRLHPPERSDAPLRADFPHLDQRLAELTEVDLSQVRRSPPGLRQRHPGHTDFQLDRAGRLSEWLSWCAGAFQSAPAGSPRTRLSGCLGAENCGSVTQQDRDTVIVGDLSGELWVSTPRGDDVVRRKIGMLQPWLRCRRGMITQRGRLSPMWQRAHLNFNDPSRPQTTVFVGACERATADPRRSHCEH